MHNKKPDPGKKKPRNTSYYKSQLNKKPKKEGSAFLDTSKKRQMSSYRRAILLLFILIFAFAGLIFLGAFLKSLIEDGEDGVDMTGAVVDGGIFKPGTPGDTAETLPLPDTSAAEPPPAADIAETFFSYNGVYLDVEQLESIESLQAFIADIKSKGINAVNIDIKKDDGTVPYHISAQTEAIMIGAGKEFIDVPLKDIIDTLHANDLYVSGTIACFKDTIASTPLIASSLRSAGAAALRWEDSDGNYWLNAYAEGAREYISGIIADSAKLGFDEIILSWFFFPNAANPASISYEDGGVGKSDAVKDFVTEQRRALDSIAPKVKFGLYIPIANFLSMPNETMGLNPGDLAERCNFIATSFAPAHIPQGAFVNGESLPNPAADPYLTTRALCSHFKYISEKIYFRPYIQAFGGYGDSQIQSQRQALYENDIDMWMLLNYDNNY